jgi:PAS domain-containing protein
VGVVPRPRETTYTKYVTLQKAKETFAAGLLEQIERDGVDRALSAEWIETLARVLSPFRFPGHGFQMASAYVGHLAPSGKIAVAAMFQAADEMRRIQRIAYRCAQLRAVRPDFGADGRQRWERDPMWQPLREAVERLLVTYDWGEAFTALCLVLKPAIDDVVLVQLAARARSQGDPMLGALLGSLDEDARWQPRVGRGARAGRGRRDSRQPSRPRRLDREMAPPGRAGGGRPARIHRGPPFGDLPMALKTSQEIAEFWTSSEFARTLLDRSLDGILAFDRDLRYTFWNRAMERISACRGSGCWARRRRTSSRSSRRSARRILPGRAGGQLVEGGRAAVPDPGKRQARHFRSVVLPGP